MKGGIKGEIKGGMKSAKAFCQRTSEGVMGEMEATHNKWHLWSNKEPFFFIKGSLLSKRTAHIIPTLGMKYSQPGNKTFPHWE